MQRLDSAIRWINLYPVDSSAISFPSTYPLYSDLSFCSTIQRFNNQGEDSILHLQLRKKVQLLTLNKIWLQSTLELI